MASGTPDQLKALVPSGLIEMEFSDESHQTAAQHALGDRYEVHRQDATLVVATSGSVADLADVFVRLTEAGIEPTGFSRQEPTLDDVFFKLTDDDKKEQDRYASAH